MCWRRSVQLAAIIVFVVAYAGLSHYSNSVATAHNLGVGLALGPVLTVGLLLVWRWTHLWVALLTAAAVAVLLRQYWPVLEKNFSVVFLLQEGGFYGLMAASFGQSLRGRRVALCTLLADKVHGPLSPQEVLYTRRVTAAWSLFFVLITVRLRAATHLVAVRQFLRAAADGTDVRGRICREAARAAAIAAPRHTRRRTGLFRDLTLSAL